MFRVCVSRFVAMWVWRVDRVVRREDFRARSWGRWWGVLLVDMFCRLWIVFIFLFFLEGSAVVICDVCG